MGEVLNVVFEIEAENEEEAVAIALSMLLMISEEVEVEDDFDPFGPKPEGYDPRQIDLEEAIAKAT